MANSILLKNVPNDVLVIILEVQGKMKVEKCIKQYSMEQSIYKMIRNYKRG